MSEKPHILALSSWFPTTDNPQLGNFITRHLSTFSKKYHVTWLILEGKENQEKNRFVENINESFQVIRISYPKKNKLFNLFKERKILLKELNKLPQTQLIIGNVVFPKGLQFIWAKHKLRCPLLVIEHSATYRKVESDRWNFLQKMIHKKVLKKANHVAAVSTILQKDIQELFYLKSTSVLPNVIANEFFVEIDIQKNEGIQFVHISNLDEQYKNVFGIFEAFSTLLSSGIDARLIIISDLHSEEHVQWVANHNLNDKIIFQGPFEASEIHILLSQSTAYIHNSNYETFSCVLAECLAVGIPIISTPVGIAASFEEDVFLKVDKQHSLYSRLVEVIDSLYIIDFQKQKNLAQNFREDKVLGKFDEIFNRLIKK